MPARFLLGIKAEYFAGRQSHLEQIRYADERVIHLFTESVAFEPDRDPFLPLAPAQLCETMRLLQPRDTGEFSFTKDSASDEPIPPYAILSHTWENGQETIFQDIIVGTGKSRTGYAKIQFCAQQAKSDGLEYFWVDTCCIDQSSHGELQIAINSMFRWCQNAAKCCVYLRDVSTKKRKASDEVSEYAWEPAFQQSKWFTRGWTLQELLAPIVVEFYSREWEKIGDKRSLRQQIHKIITVSTDIRLIETANLEADEALLTGE